MCRTGLIGGWVGKMHVFLCGGPQFESSSSIGRIHDLIGIAEGLSMIGLTSARNWACYVLFDQLMNLDILGILSALCSTICNANIVWTSYINTSVLLWTYEYDCFLFFFLRRQNHAILTRRMRKDVEKNWIKVWIWLVVALGGTWH